MLTNPIFSSLFFDDQAKERARRLGTVYNGYRVIIALFFSLNFLLAQHNNHLYFWYWGNLLPTFGYVLFGVVILIAYYHSPKNVLLMLGLTVDMVLLSFMLYFSGGADLQTVLLFLVTVAAAFMLVTTSQAILLTIFAITLVLYQQFYHTLKDNVSYSVLSNVGLMAVSFVGVAYLSHTLSKRIKHIERLSQQQTNEVNALNALNQKVVQIIDQGVLVVSHSLDILLANDTAIHQLNLPMTPSSYSLFKLDPNLAHVLLPVIMHSERDIIYRCRLPQDTANTYDKPITTMPIDYRLRITQLGPNHALILSENLRREQSHAQQLKLASLGQLTASIAHEIRNPLAAISQASQLLIEEAHEPESNFSDDDLILYEMIYNQTKRVNHIIEDVLKLSRQQKPNQQLINPAAWLANFIANHYAHQPVELICQTQQSFLFDPYQLEQVLVNLINNGLRFSGKDGNQAFVSIKVLQDAQKIHIDVTDTGPGVSSEIANDLFNPFFTTDHQGTGLGLYLSQAFCQANNASLQYMLHQRPTCFRISCKTTTTY